MKKYFFLIVIFSFVQAYCQPVWNFYSSINGQIFGEFEDVLIEDAENIWLLSHSTLRRLNSKTGTITLNVNNQSGGLASQNYKALRQANNRIWFASDSGITSISNGTITNYNGSNGLISNNVEDLAVDTNGNLWIAGPDGVSYFNGTNFTHDTTVSAYHIAIDDSNRVIIIDREYDIIFNNNGPFSTQKVLTDTGWVVPVVTGLDPSRVGLLKIDFKKTAVGNIILSQDFDEGYYKLSYPFHLDSVRTYWPRNTSRQTFRIENLTVSDSGRTWLVANHEHGIFSSADSVLEPVIINPEFVPYDPNTGKKEVIASGDGVVVIGSRNGIYVFQESDEMSIYESELSGNLVRSEVSAFGSLFHNFLQDRAGLEYPKGSNIEAIFESYFVHTHKKIGSSSFSFENSILKKRKYDIGPVSSNEYVAKNWIVHLTKDQINHHRTFFGNRGYQVPDNINNWPSAGNVNLGIANDLAPYVDLGQNGCYEPEYGDYPAIKGDEAVYWINHSGMFEYHYMMYAFNDSTELQNVIFLEHTIINRDSVKLDSIKMGLYVDFDLGNSSDDYLGCDTNLNTFYVYNADSFDEGTGTSATYNDQIPSLGITFLTDSMDSFLAYTSGNSSAVNPSNLTEFRNVLNGKWKDGVPQTLNGNARDLTSAQFTKFGFTGSPLDSTTWSELHTQANPPSRPFGDRSGFASIPHFALTLNERKTTTIALTFAYDTSQSNVGASVDDMLQRVTVAKNKYLSIVNSGTLADTNCYITTGISNNFEPIISSLKIYPNPSNGNITLVLPSEKVKQELALVYNSKGSLVHKFNVTNKSTTLDFNLPPGIYLIRVGALSSKLIIQ